MLSPDPLPLALYRPPIVLVVESRTSVRSSTCRLLRALGYDGRPARDGQHALRMLRQHPTLYQLVLTNVLLPDMDSGELIQRVAEAWPGTRVMVTAEYAPIGRPAAVLAAYPDVPVLRKPFGFRELYEAVCRLVGPPRAAVPLMSNIGVRSRRRTRITVP
ncbi:MAG TPA: response regulator [Gemmatimonadales bacterium]|nr:response regulator [Gemmatimonadales bacterium]